MQNTVVPPPELRDGVGGRIPATIGSYRIIRLLGEGGMGAVYEAEQENPRRTVALKVIKPGLADAAMVRRFQQEAQALGRLQHPGIAQIHEAGTADAGFGLQPYFAMEFIRGRTLANHVRDQRLTAAQRLELMAKVCDAAHHAHQRGLIHRDLKPGNIIVDETGQPKILDFGVARATDSDAQATRQTDAGQIVGTLAYMSPEQVLGDPHALDIRSDVYSLGVILYELLAERMPYDINRVKIHEAVQAIINSDPAPLRAIQRAYRGDIETIVTKALEKDKRRRYSTAADLAGDIRRHLNYEPIIARPPSVGYRLRKFSGRHRFGVIGVVAALVLATASAVLTYRQTTGPKELVRLAVLPWTAADRDSATAASVVYRDLTSQIQGLHGDSRKHFVTLSVDESQFTGPDGTSNRIVTGATHLLRGTLARRQAEWILNAVLVDPRSGVAVKNWGARYADGEIRYAGTALTGFVSEAFDLPPLEATPEVQPAALADYQAALSHVRTNRRVDDALAASERAVAADPDSALVYAVRAEAEWLKFFLTQDVSWKTRMEESVRQAEIRNPDLAAVHRISGLLQARAGHYELAEAHYRRAIKLDPSNGDGYRRLGYAHADNNKISEARLAFQKALELDSGYFRLQQDVGSFYLEQMLYRDALPYLERAVELAPDEPNPRFALAVDYENLGLFEEATRELRQALKLQETVNSLHLLGIVLMYQRRESDAIPYLERALKLEPERYLSWLHLGVCYRRTARAKDAAEAFQRGLQAAEREMASNPRSGYVRSFLAYLCAATGNPRRAESEVAQALQLSPTNDDARWTAALTYESIGRRDAALAVLAASTAESLASIARWPDASDLCADPRFQQLLKVQHNK